MLRRQSSAKQHPSLQFKGGRGGNGSTNAESSEAKKLNAPKRDFFGRVISNREDRPGSSQRDGEDGRGKDTEDSKENETRSREKKAWVSYHEGFSNAVRKRISMAELLSGL